MNRIIFLLGISLLLISRILSQPLDDIDKVKLRLKQISLDRMLIVKHTVDMSVDDMLQSMDKDGSWPDLNYQDTTRSQWSPAIHLRRIFELGVQYQSTGSVYYGDQELYKKIIKGIAFWVNEKPTSLNYWWKVIGTPILLGGVFVLVENDLDKKIKNEAIEMMSVGVKPGYYDYYGPATGQNLFWLASAHIYASALSEDTEGLRRAFEAISNEIKITRKEGIQPDFSFHQHGNQLNSYAYGRNYAITAVQSLFLSEGTDFELPNEKKEIISDYILSGLQWMTRYDWIEYTAIGRGIVRPPFNRGPLLSSIKKMMEIDGSRREEYQEFYQRLSGSRDKEPLMGNRYFWRSDLMVHHRKDYYFSIKGASDRILSGESGNGENIKGFFLGNGTHFLITGGNEYSDIFPVWDWRKIPGALCEQKSKPIPLIKWGHGARGKTSFVYGLNDGYYGVFGYDYQKSGVKAKRSWFLFDNEIVNISSGINGDSLYQSINQCIAHGPTWFQEEDDKKDLDRTKVFHDSVGYLIFPGGQNVEINTEIQTGSWNEINSAASKDKVSKEVFSLGIRFGPEVRDASISYVLIPGRSLSDFKKYDLSEHITILNNSDKVHAVFQKDLDQVQAVFYSANAIRLPWKGIAFEMKKPGLALIKKQGQTLVLYYGQPNPQERLMVELNDEVYFENERIKVSN